MSRPFDVEFCERALDLLREEYVSGPRIGMLPPPVRRLIRAWEKELKWAKRVARKRAMAATPAGRPSEPGREGE